MQEREELKDHHIKQISSALKEKYHGPTYA